MHLADEAQGRILELMQERDELRSRVATLTAELQEARANEARGHVTECVLMPRDDQQGPMFDRHGPHLTRYAIVPRERWEALERAEAHDRDYIERLEAQQAQLLETLQRIAAEPCEWVDEYTGKRPPNCTCNTCDARAAVAHG